MIRRFLDQLTLVDLQFQGDPGLMRQAVWSCHQEEPVDFRGQRLYDCGVFPKAPLSGRITWKIMQPWGEPKNDKEREAKKGAFELMEMIRERTRRRREEGSRE